MAESLSSLPPTEEMPTYWQFLKSTVITFREFGLNWEKYPVDYDSLRERISSVTAFEATAVFGLAMALTLSRYLLTGLVYNPLGRWLRLRRQDMLKFAESCWKLMLYGTLWSYSCHVIIFSGRHDYFVNPCRIWNVTFPEIFHEKMPQDVQTMYLLQTSFYVHSVFATLRMDAWRKDSIMMLFHHGITILLLYFSYCMRYHKTGSLVLLLHDLSDVFLEFTKLNVYLKSRGGVIHKINDYLSSLGFSLFALSWAWCRLYWFPLKVLHSTNWGAYLFHVNKDPKMYLALNSMLFMLQLLHIYWFYFIMLFLYKIATGQVEAVEDTREYDSDADDSTERRQKTDKQPHVLEKKSNGEKEEITNGYANVRHRNGAP